MRLASVHGLVFLGVLRALVSSRRSILLRQTAPVPGSYLAVRQLVRAAVCPRRRRRALWSFIRLGVCPAILLSIFGSLTEFFELNIGV